MNATTHEIGLLWLDAIANSLKCTLDQQRSVTLWQAHFLCLLPLHLLFLLQQVLLPLALFSKKHMHHWGWLSAATKKCSLGTHQEPPLSHCCHQLGDACMGW